MPDCFLLFILLLLAALDLCCWAGGGFAVVMASGGPAPRSPSSLTCGPQPSTAPTGWRSLGQNGLRLRVSPAPAALPARSQPQWRRPLVELCVEPAGLCGRCTGVAVSTQSQFPYLWSAALHCTHGIQPQLIQGIRSRDGVGEGQGTSPTLGVYSN